MKKKFLDKIVANTREMIAFVKSETDFTPIRLRADEVRSVAEPHRFRTALEQADQTNIIAEIKRASPSKGMINPRVNVREVARAYESGGAAAISVLTENEFFRGSQLDLMLVSQAARIPTLRKDFMVDECQIYEAAAYGADAILLIVAALSEKELLRFQKMAEGLGMDVLVEVHTSEELEMAKNIGANIIGINNRDLQSLEVSLDVSRRLIAERPQNALMIAESGISTREEINELKALGFDGFLIGETLMRSGDIVGELRNLTTENTENTE